MELMGKLLSALRIKDDVSEVINGEVLYEDKFGEEPLPSEEYYKFNGSNFSIPVMQLSAALILQYSKMGYAIKEKKEDLVLEYK